MLIVMKAGAATKELSAVMAQIKADGYQAHLADGIDSTLIGVVGEGGHPLKEETYRSLDGVERVERVTVPYPRASRVFHPLDTVIPLNGSQVGGSQVIVIAGPCSVESREQIVETACAVKEAGAAALRGGAFKPRTSPYAFPGYG